MRPALQLSLSALVLMTIVSSSLAQSQAPLPSLQVPDAPGPYYGQDANGYNFEKITNVAVILQRQFAGNNRPVSRIDLSFDFSNAFDHVGMQKLPSQLTFSFINSHGQVVNAAPFVQDLTGLDAHCTYPQNPVRAHLSIQSDFDFVGKDIQGISIAIPRSAATGGKDLAC